MGRLLTDSVDTGSHRWCSAVHEAAHVVAAHAQGQWVLHAHIADDDHDDVHGYTEVELDDEDDDHPVTVAVIALAGHAAEWRAG